MRARRLLYSPSGEPRLFVPGVVGVLLAFLFALAVITFTNRPRTDEQRAETLVRSGRPAAAERIYARLVQDQPSVPTVIALLEAHNRAVFMQKLARARGEDDPGRPNGMGLADPDAPLTEVAIDLLLTEIPEDVATVARFTRGLMVHQVPEDVRTKVESGAESKPPLPWSNHLLAREAEQSGRHFEAAAFYEKEGLAFPERREDIDTSLRIWMTLDAWDVLRERLSNEQIAALAGPTPKYRLAVHDRDWRAAVRWLPAIWAPSLGGTGLAMSAIAALGWFFFCARLGKLGQRPAFRVPVYVLAFALGVASVFPTVLLIAFEEAKLHLVETGDTTRDILFFVFGVGLREEAAKLLLFLPLLPLLRKKGDKLDVLVCGALVGLGFAAEENLNYLAQENLHTGLGRFLTANFFHMAMTGTLASALDDFVTDRERNAQAFMRTSLFIVGIHGVYDFLLSHEELGGQYFAMTAFVLLTRFFLAAVDTARRRGDRGITPLHAFVFAVAIVTGVSLAYAVLAVGVKGMLLVMGSGLLGEAIIVYVFVRTLHRM